MKKFDYQKKVWGGSEIRLRPTYLGFLRLKYCLKDLLDVGGLPPRVLDAGCGGGGFAKALKFYRPDLEVFGVDINENAISRAQKDSQGVNFRVGDIYKIPYKDKSFSAVLTSDVLEHLEKPEKALKEINRVLKPRGVLSAFVPLEGTAFSLHFWLSKLGWKSKEHLAGHIQKFSREGLLGILNKNGFKIDTLRYSVHFLGQIVDIGFFALLSLLSKNLRVGLEDELKGKPILNFFKNFVTTVTNIESQIFHFVPGAGIHIKAIKK